MRRKRRLFKIALVCMVCALFVLRKAIVEESFLRSSRICLESLVPSLFPFMIAADLLCRGVCKGKWSVLIQLLLGWAFGFPISARSGAQSYSDGKINTDTFRMMICCGGIPSLPFTVGVCGDIFGRENGIVLYFICLASAMFCIPFFDIFADEKGSNRQTQGLSISFGEELSCAISSSTYRMLSVCGYVCFFSALCDVLLAKCNIPLIKSVISGFLEFSGGVISCGTLGKEGFILCSAILSFSGLSVYMQILSVIRESGISGVSKEYLWCRAVQSILSALAATGYALRETPLGKVILSFMLCIFFYQFFRILQLIYRKSLKKGKSKNIIKMILSKPRSEDNAF